jgi:hypothetical protein
VPPLWGGASQLLPQRWRRQRQQIDEHLGQRGARNGPEIGQAGRSGLAQSRSLMLLGQLLTCSLMHVGP